VPVSWARNLAAVPDGRQRFGRLGAMLPRALVALACLVLLAGCGDDEPFDEPTPLAERAPTATVAPPFDARLEPAEAVLSLVPSTATTLSVTDFDTVRVELGVPDLSSEDPVTERWEFWGRAGKEAALLTDGILRAANSELLLDYGFTQDDVDWEAHFAGPDESGFVIRFRPDLPLAGVTRAVEAGVGPLAGAEVVPEDHLVVSGTAGQEEQVWANEPVWDGLVGARAESTYAHRGCVPVTDALGPAADAEHLAAVDAAHPVHILDDLPAFSVAFGDHLATVRMEENREDLFTRLDVGRDWPMMDFPQTFRTPVGDPATGRIGYDLPRPPAAASLALLEELPFAICNEMPPLEEPTGL
jgi:hypothetical protein